MQMEFTKNGFKWDGSKITAVEAPGVINWYPFGFAYTVCGQARMR